MAGKEEQLVEVLGVLAEGVRFRILTLISSRGEMTAKDILEEFDFTQPTLSHHMSVLTGTGLVNLKRKGRFAYYSINKETIELVTSGINALTGEAKAIAPVKKPKAKDTEPVAEDKKSKKKKKKKDKAKKKKKD